MPQIVRAEFLAYANRSRNSDKVFNVFLIEDDDGTYACVTEYGRRGSALVRDTLCARAARDIAESKLRQKISAKRNHRETPYSDDSFGQNISPLAREYGFNRSRAGSSSSGGRNSNRSNQEAATSGTTEPKPNVIAFPAEKKEIQRTKPKQGGILNQEQFDSLEI